MEIAAGYIPFYHSRQKVLAYKVGNVVKVERERDILLELLEEFYTCLLPGISDNHGTLKDHRIFYTVITCNTDIYSYVVGHSKYMVLF